jgi:hypothetical protein
MTDVLTDRLPPVVACPTWCTETCHPWEPDGDEWVRRHEAALPLGRLLGVPVGAAVIDTWHGAGTLDRTEAFAVIDGTPVELADLRELAQLLES